MAVTLGNCTVPFGGQQPAPVPALVNAIAAVLQELRLAGEAILARVGQHRPSSAYDTLWLELVLDIGDASGERAVLTRRQCLRFHTGDSAVVRELVWGEGEQLVRYTAAGARRLTVQPEGSKRAVLLSPDRRPGPGDRLTITSRRTIRGGFRAATEYCEALLERPTGRLDFTILFPQGRPPREGQLILATTETVLRTLRVRYGPDGRAVLRCRVRQPAIATTYSLRWVW